MYKDTLTSLDANNVVYDCPRKPGLRRNSCGVSEEYFLGHLAGGCD